MSGFHQTWTDPHYPICEGCEEETINDAGWCPSCEAYAEDTAAFQRAAALEAALDRINAVFGPPRSELQRTGSGYWQ